ncbi:odorant receptor 94b-like [Bradysia coprophila]|uniref:odorant receptor 94b-like n=1 Tax=Bradysia coprophila TaxID=38358 RepID=UPI00187D7826|nr:odorant receptor 94b-like [Bradysia coprophila]
MHFTQIHDVISLMKSTFHFFGVWHSGDKATVKEMRIKLFYCIYHSLFPLSVFIGAINSGKPDNSIFLADISIGAAVLTVKLWILVWKQNEILNLLDGVCVFSIRSDDDHNRFNDKLKGFMKFVFVCAIIACVAGSLGSVILSLIGSKKTLFLEIGYPLDYENSGRAFWTATIFLVTEVLLSLVVVIFTMIIWYFLFICSLRYEVLGSELKDMGRTSKKGDANMTKRQAHIRFFGDLQRSIDAHLHLRELPNDVESFFADIFLIQFGVSGLCICGSIYCLAFDISDNLLERLIYIFVFFYYIAELFMITYFGNEIMLSSNRLSHNLFESEWYDQPQSTKKCILIFGEYLKQPQELVIGKSYPLTLETFTRILNSAYSMFNILKSFQ